MVSTTYTKYVKSSSATSLLPEIAAVSIASLNNLSCLDKDIDSVYPTKTIISQKKYIYIIIVG